MADRTVAPIPFRILKYCGLWRPERLSPAKRALYDVYTGLMMAILATITLSVSVSVSRMPASDEKFAESVFLMFALVNALCKAANLLLSRGRIIRLLGMVEDERWSKRRGEEESEISDRYKRTIRKISVYFTTAVFIAIALRVIAPLLDLSEEIKLPVDAYSPCDVRSSTCYWSVYTHQAIGTGVATLIHAAKDCLISGLLLQACAHLEILKHRLSSVAELCENRKGGGRSGRRDTGPSLEAILIAECVQDHESIFENTWFRWIIYWNIMTKTEYDSKQRKAETYRQENEEKLTENHIERYAKTLNSSLNVMLFGQIAVTIPNLCLSIYLMSTQSIVSIEFMMTVQFFSAVVIELFFFCWYGNEVTLHSLDIHNAVYEMDWPTLAVDSRKELLLVMIRTSRPILFKVGPIMNMNIDSFLNIIKTSYSAFSVLQSTGT